jgi:hypothetical protein
MMQDMQRYNDPTRETSGRDPSGRETTRQLLSYALSYRAHSDGTVDVFDFDFAAYCLMLDLPVAEMVEEGFKKNGQPAKYKFTFLATKDDIHRLSVEYTNSESARHSDCVRRLKKAIRSTCPREG